MRQNRRDFIKAAAVGTGVAWAARQIISTPAAAAQSLLGPVFKTFAGAHDVPGDDLTITVGNGAGELDVTTGDFLIAITANHIDDTHQYGSSTPAGWTLIDSVDSVDAGGQNPGVRTRMYTRIAAGEVSYTFGLETTPPVASSAWTLVIVAYTGALSLDPAAPATATAPSGVGSITVGGITATTSQITTIVAIGSENPVSPWTAAAGYTERVDYLPNNSVPEIYFADAFFNATSSAAATFTETQLGHPYVARMIGLSPLP